jgi:hypothetical protein
VLRDAARRATTFPRVVLICPRPLASRRRSMRMRFMMSAVTLRFGPVTKVVGRVVRRVENLFVDDR